MDNNTELENIIDIFVTSENTENSQTSSSHPVILNKRQRDVITNELGRISAKRFRSEQPESSADSVTTDYTHIVFFEPFLNYPITVTVRDDLWIEPKYWALAFLQMDIQSVTEVLCKALLTWEELQKRDPMNPVDTLPHEKTLVILRLAKWMMNKEQDPWAYNPQGDGSNYVHPTEEEQILIEQVFQQVSTVYPRGSICACNNTPINPLRSFLESNQRDIQDISSTTTEQENDPRLIVDKDHYFKHFAAFMALSSPINPIYSAHAAKINTQLTIKQNNDIFVDAVQFSRGRWAKAFKRRNVAEMADVLFRKYWTVDYKLKHKKFTTFNEFCAVKRLAIIRAVAWMKDKNHKDPWGFDSTISNHNLFLSVDEIRKIESFINTKYQEETNTEWNTAQRDTRQIQRDNDQHSLSMDVGSSAGYDTSISANSSTDSLNPVEIQNESNVGSFSSSASSQHPVGILDSSSSMMALTISNGLTSTFSTTENSQILNNNNNSSLLDGSVSPLSTQQFIRSMTEIQIPDAAEPVNFLDSLNSNVVSTVVQAASSQVSQTEQLYPIFDENYDVKFPRCLIKRTVWERAYDDLKSDDGNKSLIKVGKQIFEKVFEEHEIVNQTLSGKGRSSNKSQLDIVKVNSVLSALCVLKALKTEGKGALMPHQVKLVPMEALLEKELRRKIFGEHRNHLAEKYKDGTITN